MFGRYTSLDIFFVVGPEKRSRPLGTTISRSQFLNLLFWYIEKKKRWKRGADRNRGQSDRRVFSQGSESSNRPLYALGTHSQGSNGSLDAFIRNDGNSTQINHVRSLSPVFDNSWHHVCWIDDNGAVELYVDGQLDGANFSYTPSTYTFDKISLGAIRRATAVAFFLGDIDHLMLWGRALEPAEVLEVMQLTEQERPWVSGVSQQNGQMDLEVQTPGPWLPHLLEYKEDLMDVNWSVVSGVTATPSNSRLLLSFPMPFNDRRYYRLSY